MSPKPLPAKLYKYRSFNVNSLRLLTDAQVYYANPRRFNDPLDCDPTISVDVNRHALECLCYKMLLNTGITETDAKNVIAELRYASTEYGDYKTDASIDRYLKEQLLAVRIKRLLDDEMGKKGVFSLSETWRSSLMWSHYADEHRGICLEFDTTQISHPNIAAVDYHSPRSVKASDLIGWKLQASPEAAQRVHDTYFFAKSPQWKYEKEWRDIRESNGDADAGFLITAIYFGLRCDAAVITTVVRLLGSPGGMAFFEIYPRDDSFSLKRRPVDVNEVAACGVRDSAILAFKDVIVPDAH
ncbi:MAG TPA: DUF2971 domain-containing protein [Acidobacteriaceae bacterium]